MPVFIVEGFATACSVHIATGETVVVAFNAGNILEVAKQVREAFEAEIVIMADNDQWTKGNPGLSKAKEAAKTINAHVVLPQFKDTQAKPTDFNDLHTQEGIEEVNRQIMLQVEEQNKEKNKSALGLRSIADLLKEPIEEMKWVVDDILPVAGLSILSAKPKVGKSTLSKYLAMCVLRGNAFLGKFNTKDGPVLYLALEEIKDRLVEQFTKFGINEKDLLYILTEPPLEGALKKLAKDCEKYCPSLVVIDHLSLLIPVKDLNNYAEVVAALTPIRNIARAYGCHILLIHHQKKAGEGQDAVLGSTALTASVDTIMTMRKVKEKRFLSTSQRYGICLEETEVEFDSESFHMNLGNTKAEHDNGDIYEAAYSVVNEDDAPKTQKEIFRLVSGKKATKIKVLDELVKDGKVTRTGQGKRGDPYVYSAMNSSLSVPSVPCPLLRKDLHH